MLAKKCDRCGKLYENYEKRYIGAVKEINGIDLIRGSLRGERFYSDTYDLCPACMESLMLFITDPEAEVVGEIKNAADT